MFAILTPTAVRDQYLRTGDGFVCAYAITMMATFKETNVLHDRILMLKDVPRVPFILVGNKMDLEEDREVPYEKGKELATQLGVPFLETSAKKRTNVTETFEAVVREIDRMRAEKDAKDSGKPVSEGTSTPRPPPKRKNVIKCIVL